MKDEARVVRATSVRKQLRLDKVRESNIPVTRLLDRRATMPLNSCSAFDEKRAELLSSRESRRERSSVEGEAESIFQSRRSERTTKSGIASVEEYAGVLNDVLETGLLAETEKTIDLMGHKRDIVEHNLLLASQQDLREYAETLSPYDKNVLANRVREYFGHEKSKLLKRYAERLETMNRKGLFCEAANKERARTMLKVGLRRIDPLVLEVRALRRMLNEVRGISDDQQDLRSLLTGSKRSSLTQQTSKQGSSLTFQSSIGGKESSVRDDISLEARYPKHQLPRALRARALGRAGATRTLTFRRPRRHRRLGEEYFDRIEKTHRKLEAPTSQEIAETKLSSHIPDAESSTKNEVTTNTDDVETNESFSTTLADAERRERRMKRLAREREDKKDIKRIERVWDTLEYPTQHRMDFLCKYSTPEHAKLMRAIVPLLEEVSELIVMREGVLNKMRDVKINQTHRRKWETLFTNEEFENLERVDCAIDVVDFFGVPTFLRLGAIVKSLSSKCSERLERMRHDFNEVVTFRGTDYLSVLETSSTFEASWSVHSEWRKHDIPPHVPYTTNPFLRRLGDAALAM